MADAQLKHLEQIQAYLRDPASTLSPGEMMDEVLTLALCGQAEQGNPPFDYASLHDKVVMANFREFPWTRDDVRRGLRMLGIEPNEEGGER